MITTQVKRAMKYFTIDLVIRHGPVLTQLKTRNKIITRIIMTLLKILFEN